MYAFFSAPAAQADECISAKNGFNICNKAIEFQRDVARILPQRMNSEMIFDSIFASGSKISATIIWDMNKSEFDRRLSLNSKREIEIRAHLENVGRSGACKNDAMKIFIDIGGKIQNIYKTNDGYLIHEFTIARC
jgi:hypothetical protein